MDAAVPGFMSPTMLTRRAAGAKTAKWVPATPATGMQDERPIFRRCRNGGLRDEVEIEVGEEERKCVRVENFKLLASVGTALNFVTAGSGAWVIGGPDRFEEALGRSLTAVGNFCRRDGGILKTMLASAAQGMKKRMAQPAETGCGPRMPKGSAVFVGEQ